MSKASDREAERQAEQAAWEARCASRAGKTLGEIHYEMVKAEMPERPDDPESIALVQKWMRLAFVGSRRAVNNPKWSETS